MASPAPAARRGARPHAAGNAADHRPAGLLPAPGIRRAADRDGNHTALLRRDKEPDKDIQEPSAATERRALLLDGALQLATAALPERAAPSRGADPAPADPSGTATAGTHTGAKCVTGAIHWTATRCRERGPQTVQEPHLRLPASECRIAPADREDREETRVAARLSRRSQQDTRDSDGPDPRLLPEDNPAGQVLPADVRSDAHAAPCLGTL